MISAPCPYCARPIYGGKTAQHAAVCPDNPAIHERIAAAIADPDNPGCAIASSRYRVTARGLGLPSTETLMRRWGSWEGIAAAFGLEAQRGAVPHRAPTRSEAERMAALDAEVSAMEEQADAIRQHWRDPGLQVMSSRTLPDGRVAHMLR